MTQLKEDLNTIVDELKTQRDMLVLKVHLAKADVKDEWQELEKKWEQFSARSEQVKREIQGTAGDVGEDLKHLSEDLREGYSRIKRLLH